MKNSEHLLLLWRHYFDYDHPGPKVSLLWANPASMVLVLVLVLDLQLKLRCVAHAKHNL